MGYQLAVTPYGSPPVSSHFPPKRYRPVEQVFFSVRHSRHPKLGPRFSPNQRAATFIQPYTWHVGLTWHATFVRLGTAICLLVRAPALPRQGSPFLLGFQLSYFVFPIPLCLFCASLGDFHATFAPLWLVTDLEPKTFRVGFFSCSDDFIAVRGNKMDETEVEEKALPPPPPVIPPSAKKVSMNRVPMARSGTGRKGQSIQLYTNHFKVGVANTDGFFSHYSVSLSYEDGKPIDGKGIGRKVMDRVHQTYTGDFDGKYFAYDGEKSLFTVGALPQQNFEFSVVLEDSSSNKVSGNSSPHGNDSPGEGDRKRQRRPYQSKTFKVEIRFAARIPMKAIANALRGQDSESSQEALRVLDIILRQHAAKHLFFTMNLATLLTLEVGFLVVVVFIPVFEPVKEAYR
ncbi:hypothetical protein ACLOJK_000114 [Asimina triloba]